MFFSDWLKMDLHIHSIKSNQYKQNDYKGEAYDINKLKKVLIKEGINVFSITDHNCINVDLYDDLIDNRKELLEANLNFVVGCELDITDSEIYDQDFHCLIFFDTYDIQKIREVLDELVQKKDEGYEYPDLRKIFKVFADNELEDFILIPHFNNKGKGLKDRNMHIKAIDCLKRSVFNAYEDSNNIDNIRKSFDIYTDVGHPDLPILIFSDCHDISVYPKQDIEDTNEYPTFLNVLGNLEYPFESLKLAFQDAEMRIGSDHINYFRNVSLPNNREYIESVKINDYKINLSPYQNTIIGGFGSGKTFLLNLIINGKDGFYGHLQTAYQDLLDKVNKFEIVTSDGITRNSLSELSNRVEVIQFEQNEGLFYKTILDDDEKKYLEEKLKIVFPSLDPIQNDDFDKLFDKYSDVNEILKRKITDTINYGHLFSSDHYYEVNKERTSRKINKKQEVNSLLNMLEDEKKSNILDIPIYNESERKQISDVISLIRDKNDLWNRNIELYNLLNDYFNAEIKDFNDKQLKNNRELKANRDVHNEVVDYIDQLYDSIIDLKRECYLVDERLSKQKYDEYKNITKKNTPGSYSLITSYKVKRPHEDITNALFIKDNAKRSFFQSLLNQSYRGLSFRQNKTDLKECMDKYFEDIFLNNFTRFKYDIQKDGNSIMEKSAGEKASMIIDIIFEIISTNIKQDKQTILIIDQPEDHLDNDNIEKGIVRKIREMKQLNKIPQIIFVSHNANISITSDSENIIIANKIDSVCKYNNSGIENPAFIERVCTILEGGRDALRTRGMKFSVSYLKTFEKSN